MSLFISFEGGEATGKSLQARLLLERLRRMGYRCFSVSEPGGTRLGEYLRPLLKGEESLTPIAELLLFSASRAQLVDSQITPELQKGSIVIIDRYVDSTTAYQGYGYEDAKGRPTLRQVQSINLIATRNVMPNLTVLLDMDPEEALSRRALRLSIDAPHGPSTPQSRLYEEEQSKFENKSMAFHRKVRAGYLKLAKKEPQRWLVIDARKPVDTIETAIWNKVQSLLDHRTADLSLSQDNLENRRLI